MRLLISFALLVEANFRAERLHFGIQYRPNISGFYDLKYRAWTYNGWDLSDWRGRFAGWLARLR